MIAKPRPPAFPEHLRKELQERVERFRDRHRDHSLPLPFEESDPSGKIVCFPSPTVAPVGLEERLSSARPARSSYRQEVASPTAPQSTLEFSDSASEEETAWWVLPVAPLRRRVMGHLTDVGIVMGAAAVFLLPLPLVGGRIVPDAMLLGGIACGALLLALLYGWIFLVRTGTTPGMRFAGLRLVNFDGLSTTPRQRLWRLGGVVVSAGSFLIGFLWAALDEEKLYWHDHISKTFLTASDQ
jgi:uncharacterized RDD family membrane protein YckC